LALATQFEQELYGLFHRRTTWLRKAIGKHRPGRPHEFTRKSVIPRLQDLSEIAAEIITGRRAKKEFRKAIEDKRQWQAKRGKGWDRYAKKESFRRWYERHIGSNNCVYVFWSDKTCEYVGRTIHGHGRPVGWFTVFWFHRVTRIDIYTVHRKSEVGKAECLAIHMFAPRQNQNLPSIQKYTKKCPICEAIREINYELGNVFRLR
jgi:hypothetical protein